MHFCLADCILEWFLLRKCGVVEVLRGSGGGREKYFGICPADFVM